MFPSQFGQVHDRVLLGEYTTFNHKTRTGQYKVIQLPISNLFNLINNYGFHFFKLQFYAKH